MIDRDDFGILPHSLHILVHVKFNEITYKFKRLT